MEFKTSYHYPETKEEWWNNVNHYWTNLRKILQHFLPVEQKLRYAEETTDSGLSPSDKTLMEEIEFARKYRDRDLARYLSMAWHSAPDTPNLHRIPSWGVLCDLLSEEYVLYEEEE